MLNACLVEDNSPCKRAEEIVSFLNCLDKSGMYQNAAIQKKKTHNHQYKQPFMHIPRPETALKFKEKGVSS